MACRKGTYGLVFLFCLISVWCRGIEYQPWIGNYFEFEWRNSLLYQYYPYVATRSSLVNRNSHDLFLATSLSNAVKPEFSLEFELVGARTRKQKLDVDHFSLAGRYVWLDDIAGDSLTLTTGFNLTQAFQASLRDISSFHHGRGEAEIFVSFGQEYNNEDLWNRRWWGVVGVGVADRGSAWLHGDVFYEARVCTFHEWRVGIRTLWGLGHQHLKVHDFHGYGSLQHQSVDLALRYTQLIEYFGSWNIEYSYRVHARNFPAQAHQLLFSVLYTFGL